MRFAGQFHSRIALFLCTLLACAFGCRPLSLDDARKIAEVASWTGDNRVSIREKKTEELWSRAKIVFGFGPQPSKRAALYIRRYDVEPNFSRSKLEALKQLRALAEQEPDLNKEFTLSELAFHEATVDHRMGRREKAKTWYLASVYHAYRYLFSTNFDAQRNAYAPEFRMTVDYYNRSLENLLRILNKEDGLKPNVDQTIEVDNWVVHYRIQLHGPWREEEIEKIEFANDFEIEGIGNKHRTEGLGVPLIAVRRRDAEKSRIDKYYPTGLALPMTAFLRFNESCCEVGSSSGQEVECAIEFHDSLRNRNVLVGNRNAPLESDITTPLAYFLQNPLVSTQVLETLGLLQGDLLEEVAGLYMLEPYDPNRVPIVMVHGLWSGPFTWLEMFNELRALPEIRENCQFWFYLYPTGQPFWLSARNMRQDLAEARDQIDPGRQIATLDQMVLVGHSMGGLISRLQTIDSGDTFWKIVSDRPFEEMDTDDRTRQDIRDTLFFRANPSVKRVVTIGTPHRGSKFANNFTRWLGHKVIRLPDMLNESVVQKIRNRDQIFRNPEVLTTRTSIDSLSPESPFLSELVNARSAPWVTTHNIVGDVKKRQYLGLAGDWKPTHSDGIVSTESSMLESAVSSVTVNARHQDIHLQPKTILEIRRILLAHVREVQSDKLHQARNSTPDTTKPARVQPASFETAAGPEPLRVPPDGVPVPANSGR